MRNDKGQFVKGHSVSRDVKRKIGESMKEQYASGKRKPPRLGKHWSIEARRKIGENFKKNYRPENHPRWKGGIDIENKRIKASLEYIIWRNEVYTRDNWTCRICEKHCQRKNIVAHHLKLFSEFPELRFSVDNGITLCRNCHCLIHKPQQFNNIMYRLSQEKTL